jgi:transposase
MEGMVTLNVKEQKKVLVLSKVERGEMVGHEAAGVLGISLRHFRRLAANYRSGGVAAMAHGNRGKLPANTLDVALKERVLVLAKSTYAGCNTLHMTDLLEERDDIKLSCSSVRRLLVGAGITRPRHRRPPKHRSRRERYAQEGMFVQVDGSRHDWLEGRGSWLTLVGGIDDATGKVLHALFREQEDTQGYFDLMEGILAHHGLPLAVYHDGHAVFEVAEHVPLTVEEQLTGKPAVTQFGRLLSELDITSIRSRSPQARGRVERLWGTLQDRLVTELRLSGVKTLSEANELLRSYLPRHNRKFAVPAAAPGTAFRTAAPGWRRDFCLKHTRTVGLDNVIRFGEHRLQVLPNSRYSYARAKVEVREGFDGTISAYYQGHRLLTQPAPSEAPAIRRSAIHHEATPRAPAKAAPDHPWRGRFRSNSATG